MRFFNNTIREAFGFDSPIFNLKVELMTQHGMKHILIIFWKSGPILTPLWMKIHFF